MFFYATDIIFVFQFHPKRDMAVPHLMKAEWHAAMELPRLAKWFSASSAVDTAARILSPQILLEWSSSLT